MRKILIATLLTFPAMAFSQVKSVDVSTLIAGPSENFYLFANGMPSTPTKYTRINSGSPYYKENFEKATLVFPNGKAAKDQLIRLDLVTGEIQFKNDKGDEMIATIPVERIIFTTGTEGQPEVFLHGSLLPTEDKKLKTAWFLDCSTGNAPCYQLHSKKLDEYKQYNSATTEINIVDKKGFYTIQNNVLVEVKKGRKK